jgi:hypothetical protein
MVSQLIDARIWESHELNFADRLKPLRRHADAKTSDAIIAAVLFAAGFVAWNYYPHSFGLPIIKTIEMGGVPG